MVSTYFPKLLHEVFRNSVSLIYPNLAIILVAGTLQSGPLIFEKLQTLYVLIYKPSIDVGNTDVCVYMYVYISLSLSPTTP